MPSTGSYAQVNPTSGVVVNVIVWDGVTAIPGITDTFFLIPLAGRTDVAYIGGTYDQTEDVFLPPE